MRLIFGALFGMLIGAGIASAEPQLASGKHAVRVERGVAQLFVDDHLIETQDNLKRTLHQPKKDHGGNVPMIAAKPETGLLAYGSIVRDTKLDKYVMFVQEFPSRAMYRMTSPDGLNWDAATHDQLTPVKMDTHLEALPEALRERFGIDLFSCYYDQTDDQYPYKGWLWFANAGDDWEGIWYMRSRDGLDWERVRQIVDGVASKKDPTCRIITQAGRTVHGPGDVTTFYYDAQEDRFLGAFKFFSLADVRPGFKSRCRAYAFLDRIDQPFNTDRITHIELMPAMAEKNGDHVFDEYYASTAWRYESLWLGGLKIYHGKGRYPYSDAGCAFLKLLVSRDGLDWHKVPFANDAGVPEVFLPNGPEGGHDAQNDGGYISEFSQGPLRANDELIYYYTASSWGKSDKAKRIRGGGIFRARLRIDGFVSVDWGRLTTRPLAIQGDDLTVNGRGPITIRALSGEGNPLAAATIPEGEDALAHPVDFDGRALGELTDDPAVRLQFEVDCPGALYSFTAH